MSDKEISAVSEVLDIVDDSEVKSESADDWPPVSIKQESDLDAAATNSSSALNVASLVTFLLFFVYLCIRMQKGGAKIFGSTLLQPARFLCVFLSAFFIVYVCTVCTTGVII